MKFVKGKVLTIKDLLESLDLKLAVAESLTSGMVASKIAEIPGISTVFNGSVTSYTNEIKNTVLGINKVFLSEYGPYNFDTTHQMCDGVMKLMNADVAVATSGVAGPGDDFGVKQGTVYITVKIKDKYFDLMFQSSQSDRNVIREEATNMAYLFLEQQLYFKFAENLNE